MSHSQDRWYRFAKSYTGKPPELVCPVGIAAPFIAKEGESVAYHRFQGVFDTGASICAVSPKVVQAAGLSPIGAPVMASTANGEVPTELYAMALALLPATIVFPAVPVICMDLGHTDVLVGLDIISEGRFTITCSPGGGKVEAVYQYVPSPFTTSKPHGGLRYPTAPIHEAALRELLEASSSGNAPPPSSPSGNPPT